MWGIQIMPDYFPCLFHLSPENARNAMEECDVMRTFQQTNPHRAAIKALQLLNQLRLGKAQTNKKKWMPAFIFCLNAFV